MAISVNWSSSPWLITIPQSDLTLVSGTKYSITVDVLWQLLRDFADGAEGSAQKVTYRRVAATGSTPPITEINDPFYGAQFEDGLYSVDIIDGNSNFRDVEVKNQVSVGTNNTTGFSIVPVGSGLDAGQDAKLTAIDTRTAYHNKIIDNLKELIKIASSWYLIIYDDGEVSGGTEILRKRMTDSTGADISDLTAGVLAAELESTA